MFKKQTLTGFLFVLVLTAAITGAYMCSASSLWADSKVGYIDLQRLVKESKMGQAASGDIEDLRVEKQAQIKIKLEEINQLKLDLNSNATELTASEKKDQVETLNDLVRDYKRMVEDAKEEIARQDRELVADILKKADKALKKVAKKNKFSIILKDPKTIGYMDSDVDITDEVLKMLNKG